MAFAVLLLVMELFVVYRLVKYRYCDEHADRKAVSYTHLDVYKRQVSKSMREKYAV